MLYTPDVTQPTDPGTGEIWLEKGQDAPQENTFVIYVGNQRPAPNIFKYGMAHQAYEGKNNEFYGYAFAGKRYDLGDKFDWLRINVELALADETFGKKLRTFLAEKMR